MGAHANTASSGTLASLHHDRNYAICEEIAHGMSLTQAAKKHGTDHANFLRAVKSDESLAHEYAHARDVRADLYFEQLDDLSDMALMADDPTKVQAIRLVVDTVKWKVGKMAPKRYGDKVIAEVTGKDGGPIAGTIQIEFVSAVQQQLTAAQSNVIDMVGPSR